VRNASNGDVEVWVEGAKEQLKSFFVWLHRGPEFSRVDAVKKEDKSPRGYKGFDVEYY
jgi:acylphosphatase